MGTGDFCIDTETINVPRVAHSRDAGVMAMLAFADASEGQPDASQVGSAAGGDAGSASNSLAALKLCQGHEATASEEAGPFFQNISSRKVRGFGR